MFGYDKIHRTEYVQVTPKTALVVTEEMRREMDRLRRARQWGRFMAASAWFAFLLVLFGAVLGAALVLLILCLKVR